MPTSDFLPRASASFRRLNPGLFPDEPAPAKARRAPSRAVVEQVILDAPMGPMPRETLYAGRVAVGIVSYRRRLLDPDNLMGGAKYFVDALRYAGAFRDDRPQDITLQVAQEKVARKEDERTEITLTPARLIAASARHSTFDPPLELPAPAKRAVASVEGLTIVCVLRSGGVYTIEWVERLFRDAKRHLRPSRLVCLSDMESQFISRVCAAKLDGSDSGGLMGTCILPLAHPWPGWFSKLEIFRPGLFSGPCLYVDLDSLILRPLPPLVGGQWPALALLDDFLAPARPASGVMAWTPSLATERIYHGFAANPVCGPGWRHGDGILIGEHCHQRLQSLWPAAFQSWKVQQRKRQLVTASILSFHGVPKNDGFPPSHWITREWIGASNR